MNFFLNSNYSSLFGDDDLLMAPKSDSIKDRHRMHKRKTLEIKPTGFKASRIMMEKEELVEKEVEEQYDSVALADLLTLELESRECCMRMEEENEDSDDENEDSDDGFSLFLESPNKSSEQKPLDRLESFITLLKEKVEYKVRDAPILAQLVIPPAGFVDENENILTSFEGMFQQLLGIDLHERFVSLLIDNGLHSFGVEPSKEILLLYYKLLVVIVFGYVVRDSVLLKIETVKDLRDAISTYENVLRNYCGEEFPRILGEIMNGMHSEMTKKYQLVCYSLEIAKSWDDLVGKFFSIK